MNKINMAFLVCGHFQQQFLGSISHCSIVHLPPMITRPRPQPSTLLPLFHVAAAANPNNALFSPRSLETLSNPLAMPWHCSIDDSVAEGLGAGAKFIVVKSDDNFMLVSKSFPAFRWTRACVIITRFSFCFSYHSDIFKWACENSVLATTAELRCVGGGLIKFDHAARSVRGSTLVPPILVPSCVT
jgi:hypothetical protein